MEITLEKVDQVRERTGVTYAEAKNALEIANGDVLEAIIYIENIKEADAKENSKIKPIDIILALESQKIEARYIWKPMHIQPYYEKFKFYSHYEFDSVAKDIFKRGLCLPSDTKNSMDDMNKIIAIIRNLFIKAT